MVYIAGYVILISLISYLIVGFDKNRAIKGKLRVPEATILLFAILGGSIGVYLGMQKFRHKTRKPLFSIGIPLIITLQVIIISAFFIY